MELTEQQVALQKRYWAGLTQNRKFMSKVNEETKKDVTGGITSFSHTELLRDRLISMSGLLSKVPTYNVIRGADEFALEVPAGHYTVYADDNNPSFTIQGLHGEHQHVATPVTSITDETVEDMIVSNLGNSLDVFVLEQLYSKVLHKLMDASKDAGDKFNGFQKLAATTFEVTTGSTPLDYNNTLAKAIEALQNLQVPNKILGTPIHKILSWGDIATTNRLVLGDRSTLRYNGVTYTHFNGTEVLAEPLISQAQEGQGALVIFDSRAVAIGLSNVAVHKKASLGKGVTQYVGGAAVGVTPRDQGSTILAIAAGRYVTV